MATEEDQYWDDNKPIVELMQWREEIKEKLRAERAIKEAELESAKRSAARSRPTSSSSTTARKKYEVYYEDTKKGLIVQNLLIRWWYAYSWPNPDEYTGDVPPGYEEMEGMKGVFVSMNLEDLGKIVDLRDKKMCPSLKNMSAKPAAELKELCIKAYEGQIAEIIKIEGKEDTPNIITLKKEMRHISRIDPDEADMEAKKFTFGVEV